MDNKITTEECLKTIRELCANANFTEDQIRHRARILYFLNRLDFWDDFPIFIEEINYQRELARKGKV